MKFVDSSEIRVKSGAGGPGLVSFRAGPNMPKAGADGGDGGHGGSVYFVGHLGINTLSCLRYRQLYQAENGQRGGPNGRTGRCGQDCKIFVPLGTEIYCKSSGTLMGEITRPDRPVLLAKGGKRGLGNIRFLRANHQVPEENTPGGPAVELDLRLELKVIADIGLAGFPNSGKSTLLSRLSAAKPKIADYPFTTLQPQLGVVDAETDETEQRKSFVLADIPGLIEGASEGKGLGHDFLKHLERTKVVAFVLNGFDEEQDCTTQYEKLCYELASFSELLAQKDRFIIITKKDLDDSTPDILEFAPGIPYAHVSAVRGDGIKTLKQQLYAALADYRTTDLPQEPNLLPSLSDFHLEQRAENGP